MSSIDGGKRVAVANADAHVSPCKMDKKDNTGAQASSESVLSLSTLVPALEKAPTPSKKILFPVSSPDKSPQKGAPTQELALLKATTASPRKPLDIIISSPMKSPRPGQGKVGAPIRISYLSAKLKREMENISTTIASTIGYLHAGRPDKAMPQLMINLSRVDELRAIADELNELKKLIVQILDHMKSLESEVASLKVDKECKDKQLLQLKSMLASLSFSTDEVTEDVSMELHGHKVEEKMA